MSAVLRTTTVSGPEVRRLNRLRRAIRWVRIGIIGPWLLLAPLLLSLLFESVMPAALKEAVGYLLAGCLLVPFGLWPVETFLERREHKARMAVFPRAVSALSALRAGWNVEWSVPSGLGSKERLTSRGAWKRRHEWVLDYRADLLMITELPEHEHEHDDDDEDGP